MKLLFIAPLLAIVLADVCGGRASDDPHAGQHPCGVDSQNPAIVLYCTNTPEPTQSSEPTETPVTTPNPSRTSLGANPKAWYDRTASYTHQLRDGSDNAVQAFPDFATNSASLGEYAAQYSDVTSRIVSAVDQLAPPPTGLESQYQTFDTSLRALNQALQTSQDSSVIVAAQSAYVNACTGLQQYDDSNNIGIDLRCSGAKKVLSTPDFFAAIAAGMAKLHADADAVEATFNALSPAQQADNTALTVYVSGVGNAYGNAAPRLADPVPPADLATKQKAVVDASNAVFDSVQVLENDIKNATDLGAEVTAAKATLAPLRAAVESACAQLQTAATAAGVTADLGCLA